MHFYDVWYGLLKTDWSFLVPDFCYFLCRPKLTVKSSGRIAPPDFRSVLSLTIKYACRAIPLHFPCYIPK